MRPSLTDGTRRDRDVWARRTAELDPERDHLEIYRILATHEFPWDIAQALSFALFRTYAVPSIGRLLAETGEFTGRVQQRYDDTGLLLDAVLEHGTGSERGRAAVRRINQMHGSYDIDPDDMRYVLATFVVVPVRWLDDVGWRRLTDGERAATVHYYRDLGRHMGIREIPESYEEFATFLDGYEREHFGYDSGGRAVADATLALMATFSPQRHVPPALARRFALALMDDPLLDAFGYPHPSRVERVLATQGLRWRSRVVRALPPRREPTWFRLSGNVRSYPDGYEVDGLGTFPSGCPVPHQAARP